MQLFGLATACSTIFFVIAQAKANNMFAMTDGHEAYKCESTCRLMTYSRCDPLVSATIKSTNATIDYLCFLARFLNGLKIVTDVAKIPKIQ